MVLLSWMIWEAELVFMHCLSMQILNWRNQCKAKDVKKTLDWVLRKFYASSITIHYHPDIRDGTSSFLFTKTEPNRTVKAGVAVFIQGNRTYIVETDLADVTKALWRGTMEEQDQWLEKRALELVQTIQIK